MDKRAFDALTQFCADQFNAFDPHAWTGRSEVNGTAIAMAAKYLSMTSWYGHEAALERIAATTQGDFASGSGFHRELQAMGFDLGHFSAAVRYAIALREEAQPTRRAERDRGGALSRMRIPVQNEQGFHGNSSIDSGLNRARIPGHFEHRFRYESDTSL